MLQIRNRYDQNGNLLPDDFMFTRLPEDAYEILCDVYTRRLEAQKAKQDISTIYGIENYVEIQEAV